MVTHTSFLQIRSVVITAITLAVIGLLSSPIMASGDHTEDADQDAGEEQHHDDNDDQDHDDSAKQDHEPLPYTLKLTIPHMDSAIGKDLFVNKLCITCHAINGIGGEDAPQIDAHAMEQDMSAFELAAKMWNHSQGMIAFQLAAFEEQVTLSGDEIAHITGFLHDDMMQHTLSTDDIPHEVQEMMHHEH